MTGRRGASPPRTRHNPQAVLDHVRAYVVASAGVVSGERVVLTVQAQLNGAYLWQDQATSNQVRRALDVMARGGELVKIGRGVYGPDGERNPRAATYYTPSAFAAAQEHRSRLDVQAAAVQEHWELIYDALGEMGIMPDGSVRGRPVRLSLAQWDQLTGLDDALARVKGGVTGQD